MKFKIIMFVGMLVVLALFCTGCAVTVTGHGKGEFVKEVPTGKNEFVDSTVDIKSLAGTTVKLEKNERFGDKTIQYYQQYEYLSKTSPRVNPFSLLVYNIARVFMGSFGLIGGVIGQNGTMVYDSLEHLILPIPDCSRDSNKRQSMLCDSYNDTSITGELIEEYSYINITEKNNPITTGTVIATVKSLSDISSLSLPVVDNTELASTKAASVVSDNIQSEKQKPALETKKLKKAKKAKKGSTATAEKVAQRTEKAEIKKTVAQNKQQPKPSLLGESSPIKVGTVVLREELQIASDGTASLDLAKLNEVLPKQGEFSIEFEYQDKKAESRITFADVQELIKQSHPADLVLTASFSDNGALIEDKTLHAIDKGALVLKVQNTGKGPSLNTVIEIKSDNQYISFNPDNMIGTINSGETRELKVPLKTNRDLTTGVASFTIQAKEKRGYDSKKIIMKIPTAKLESPQLEIASLEVNDGDSGLAKGNGNGIPESGETIELTAFIRNSGVGKSIRSKLNGTELTRGIDWVTSESALGDILPGETVKAKLAFTIPRTFSKSEISSLLRVTDIRDIAATERKDVRAFGRLAPEIRLASSRITLKDKPVSTLANGETYQAEFGIENQGKIAAKGVQIEITAPHGVELSRSKFAIGEIKQQSAAPDHSFTFTLPRTYSSDTLPFTIRISQTDFTTVDTSLPLVVELKAPHITYAAALRSTGGSNFIQQGEQAYLDFQVVNDGNLPAEGVKIRLESRDEHLRIMGKSEEHLGRITPGSLSETVKFQLDVTRRIKPGQASLTVIITQSEFAAVNEQYALNVREEGAMIVDVTADDNRRQSSTKLMKDAGPAINLKNPVRETGDESISLAFEIADIAANIDAGSVSMTVNGARIPLDLSAKLENKKQIQANVPLHEGENRIVISARNVNHAQARQEFTVVRTGDEDVDSAPVTGVRNADALAIVIGISKYEHKDISGVTYARRDAATVKEYLVKTMGFKPENIEEYYDDKATSSKLKTAFAGRLKGRVKPGITEVFVYYSGHGAPDTNNNDAYFVPYDYDPIDPSSTGYAVKELYRNLETVKAKSATVVLDTCFSGISGDGKPLIKSASPIFIEIDNPVLKMQNSVVFTSSSGKQISSWYTQKKHGLFTYYFLQGLRGKADLDHDGTVTVAELETYLSSTVPVQARVLYSREQTPQILGDKNSKIVKLR